MLAGRKTPSVPGRRSVQCIETAGKGGRTFSCYLGVCTLLYLV